MNEKTKNWLILGGCGLVVAFVAITLASFGNPKNMAICIACFLRDTTGAMNLHTASVVQYVRPEIIGIVLGAMAMSFFAKEFKPVSGSSPVTRFALGFIVMVGCLIFLGCPLRMVLRMAGGDLNAWIGLVGFLGGVATGVFFLKKGFYLGKGSSASKAEGMVFPAAILLVFVLSIASSLFSASTEGPGSMHAPLIISLIGGLVFGAVAQKSRMCFTGSVRDVFLAKDGARLVPVGVLFLGVFAYNIFSGSFNLAMAEQPIAHTEVIWNILSLYVVGFGGTLMTGCPLRQLVLAGSGSSDAAVSVFGLIVGAAFCHNFGLASSAAGTTDAGQIATIACIVLLFVIALLNLQKKEA